MNENSNLLPDLLHEEFELQVRGYSRRQVDEYVSRRNGEIRDLEQRLSRALDEAERLRRELSTVRQQALNGKPAHQEISERIAQILKLADDEARAQKDKANDEIARLRAEALTEAERHRVDAREQAERMLTAAQEQAEHAIATARSEADKSQTAARAEAERLTDDARQRADTAVASAKAQSKKLLDEATARATAIHDGAERRLNLLSTRHAETIRRLSDILEGVSGLVAAETARPSVEDEVAMTVAKTLGNKSAEISGIEGAESATAPSLLSPPHPATRVDAPGARPIGTSGVPGAAASARPPGRGPRHQAGGPPLATPAPPPGPAGTPGLAGTPGPAATPGLAGTPGPAATPPLATPAPPPGPATTPPLATPAPPPGPAGTPATPPLVTPAPSQSRSQADVAGTTADGDKDGPGSRLGSAGAGSAEPNPSGEDRTDRGALKDPGKPGPAKPGTSDPDEPTDPGRVLPG